MSEPAIQVRRKGKGTQVWTIEKLENKLVDMREHYADWKEASEEMVRNNRTKTGKLSQNIIPMSLCLDLCVFFPSAKGQTATAATRSMKHKRTTT